MERAMGIEPTSKAWEALVLPMYYARIYAIISQIIRFVFFFITFVVILVKKIYIKVN